MIPSAGRITPHWCAVLGALAIATYIAVVATDASARDIHIHVEPARTLINQEIAVTPGAYSYYHLPLERGVLLNAELLVAGGVDDTVRVWLLDLPNFQRFRSRLSYNVYRGTSGAVRNVARFGFPIPASGHYYLVVDNRDSLLFSRNVRLYVFVTGIQPSQHTLAEEKWLSDWYTSMRWLFRFPDIRISLRHCGEANAYSTPHITLCRELVDHLGAMGLPHALEFVLAHEMSHSLLNVWGWPLYDNEDVADEFASVVMMVENKSAPMLQAAQSFASESSESRALAALRIDDRHTLSPQRARNIIRWMSQGSALLSRWQNFLIPNMQPEALKWLDGRQEDWIAHHAIKQEMLKRGMDSERVTRLLQSGRQQPEAAVAERGQANGKKPAQRRLRESDLLNGRYGMQGATILLVNGKYEVGSFKDNNYMMVAVEKIEYGDLDGDGWEDAAVILGESAGGNLVLNNIAVVIEKNGSPLHVASRRVGGGAITSLSINKGVIVLEMLEHGPNDANCCPSVRKTVKYRLRGRSLVEAR